MSSKTRNVNSLGSSASQEPIGFAAIQQKWQKELPPDLVPPEPDSPRGRILAAASDLFAAHGLDGTSTRAVAEAAGVNLAMIHYYYGSKEQLYERVLLTEFLINARRILPPPPDLPVVDQLFSIPFMVMDLVHRNPKWMTLLRRELASGGTHMQSALKTLGEFGPPGLRDIFDRVFTQAVAEGRVRALPVDAVLELLISLAYGMMFMQPFLSVFFRRDLTNEAIWKEWRETVATVLRHGLLVEMKE
jgi:AcrR family transcriptional regulator